jgi:hypothetical protein
VPIGSTNGQCAGFLHTTVRRQLRDGHHVLYLGDWDHQGRQIEANTLRVLEEYVDDLEWERVALTAEQIDEHDLGDLVVVKHDGRYKRHADYDPNAWETETLTQATLTAILRDRLDDLLPEPIADVLEREAEERDEVADDLRHYWDLGDG